MNSFKGAPDEINRVAFCGTASMIQKDLQTRRNNRLPVLRCVQVVVQYRRDSGSNDTFVIVFSHKEEMGDERKTVIREILQDEAFNRWLVEKALRPRHGWCGCRIKLSSREKNEEYHWSVEKTTG